MQFNIPNDTDDNAISFYHNSNHYVKLSTKSKHFLLAT